MTTDSTGRTFKKLRVSLTHECNYACIYCTDNSKTNRSGTNLVTNPAIHAKKLLSSSEILEIIRKLHSELKLNAVRLTGGEPLLYPGLIPMVASIRALGIHNLGMTTNGHFLSGRVKSLYESGLKSVNISLDSVSPEVFREMSSRRGLSNVLRAIDLSLETGLNVKLNTVVVAGKNHEQIIPLLEFALSKGIVIRFLELMPMGPLHKNRREMFFPASQILSVISDRFRIEKVRREASATANYWSINGTTAFGIIANDSSPFCKDCNRLRLDSYGNLYGCLSSLIPVPVLPGSGSDELKSSLQLAMSHKQSTHFIGNNRTMQSIGG